MPSYLKKTTCVFFRLSTNNNVLISLQEIPAFDRETLSTELWTAIAEAERVDLSDDVKKMRRRQGRYEVLQPS